MVKFDKFNICVIWKSCLLLQPPNSLLIISHQPQARWHLMAALAISCHSTWQGGPAISAYRSRHASSVIELRNSKFIGRKLWKIKIENLASLTLHRETKGDQIFITSNREAITRGATHGHNKHTWDPSVFITHHSEILGEGHCLKAAQLPRLANGT